MDAINRWFNKLEALFFLSPSFYTILSGALIGAAINLLTGLIFTKEMLSKSVIFAILFLFASAGLLVYIGLILEDLNGKAGGDAISLSRLIHHRQTKLFALFSLAVIGIILGVTLLCYAMW